MAHRDWRLILIACGATALITGLVVTVVSRDGQPTDDPGGNTRDAQGPGGAAGDGDDHTPTPGPVRYESPAPPDGPAGGIAFSPDGLLLAAGGADGDRGIVQLWEVGDGGEAGDHVAALAHDSPVTSVAFSPGGGLLASATEEGNVWLWDPATHEQVTSLPHDRGVTSVAFSPDGGLLAAGTRGVETLELAGPDVPRSFDQYAWSVELWDPRTYEHVASLTPPENRPVSGGENEDTPVAFSPDGALLANGFFYGEGAALVHVWDAHTRQLVATLHDSDSFNDSLGWPNALAFSPDSGTVVVGGQDNVGLWNLPDARPIATARIGNNNEALSVAVSPSGKLLAVGETARSSRVECFSLVAEQIQPFDGCLEAAEGESGETVGLGYHDSLVTAVAFSPDGDLLASADYDGSVWAYPEPEVPLAER